ncbi:MAG: DUF4835 family protein [Bacteroidales bacterium]|nr:DUF4835 family protein [Bacteroidales bacterium]
MRRVIAIMLPLLVFCLAKGQEIRCNVQVNYQKLLTTTQSYESANDKKVFDNMQQAITDFINARHWTNMQLQPHEQIDMSLSLVLSTRTSATDFGGQLQIQLRRPVWGSTYTTGLFNYIESGTFNFSYNESQPLDFDIGNYYGTLSSMLAYYCYLFMGIYFDSFSPGGGEPFYAMAQQVQQAADGGGDVSFRSSSGSRSRYWFIENHTNGAYEPLHTAYYNYHRLGLDLMMTDQQRARQGIISALENLAEVNKRRSNLLSVTQFIDVKSAEIISVFTPAPQEERQRVYDIVKGISPLTAVKMKDFNAK